MVKIFKKKQNKRRKYSGLVTLVVAGNLTGQLLESRWSANMACLPISVIYCVFHLRYQVFDSNGICNICNNGGEDTLNSTKLSSEQNLAHSLLCSIDHIPGI